jgi:DNA polymerase III epsilon subunit-like protein
MLGHEMFNEIFGYPTRDTQSVAAGMNDAAAFKGLKLPFDRVGLGWLTEHFGIDLDDAHDALADALATARLYKALLNRH